MKLLSLLIPTTPDRSEYFGRLYKELTRQIHELYLEYEVEIVELWTQPSSFDTTDISLTTGAKRNKLVERAEGKYYAFIDSDDMVSPNYIKLLWPGIQGDYDCCSLIGQIYFDGKKGNPFLHSVKYTDLWQDENYYYRPINHLNCVKKELVSHIKFEEKTWGEDSCWAVEVSKAGVLKREYEVKEVLYFYYAGFPKHEII